MAAIDGRKVVAVRAAACVAVPHASTFKAASVHPDCETCAGVVFAITQPEVRIDQPGIWLSILAQRDGEAVYTDPEGYGWVGLSDACADGETFDYARALQEAVVAVVLHR